MAIRNGTASGNILKGTRAFDILDGRGGNDTLYGLEGNDVFFGGDGADRLYGSSGNDTFSSGDGSDLIFGGSGSFDAVRYGDLARGSNSTISGFTYNGVYADLTRGIARERAYGTTDTLNDVEQVLGSRYNDYIVGDTAVNFLSGETGNDFVNGGGGADRLFGSDGNDVLRGGLDGDTLSGGKGADKFQYDDRDGMVIPQLHPGVSFGGTTFQVGIEVILDFSRSQRDRIDLGLVDADRNATGDQNFKTASFLGTAALTFNAENGVISWDAQIRYERIAGNTYVQWLPASDSGTLSAGIPIGIQEIAIEGAYRLTAADFIL
jgi:Ca2+-binding RTX toxin-like protein